MNEKDLPLPPELPESFRKLLLVRLERFQGRETGPTLIQEISRETVDALHDWLKDHPEVVFERMIAKASYPAVPYSIEGAPWPMCPKCGEKLGAVTNPADSCLNDEQFAATRAGDWYCTSCKGDQADSGYRYFWNKELGIEP